MNRFRLGLSLILFLVALFPLAFKQAQASASNIQLMVEGKKIEPDVPPTIVDGRTLVPIAIVAETLGAEVEWNDELKQVSIFSDNVELEMRIGDPKAIANGKEIILDVPPQIIGDRTLVPIRFIGQALGAHVGWIDATRTVVVNEPYALTTNGKRLDEIVLNVDGELRLPLEPVAVALGAKKEMGSDGKTERLVFNDLTIVLDQSGQQWMKLIKSDAGWMIPLSIVEERLRASVSVEEGKIDIERLNRLRSVRKEEGRIYIDYENSISPNHFRMSSPERIVIDLPNTVISEQLRASNLFQDGSGVASLKAASDSEADAHWNRSVKEIRFSQFSTEPFTVRVVIELLEKVDYQLNRAGSGVEIVLKEAPVASPAPIGGETPVVPPLGKKDKFIVVVDPGHGGSDPGAIGVGGNLEKDMTLAVSNYLARELRAYDGIEVIQTRTNDVYPTLQDRVEMANRSQADVFLSIHGNSFNRAEIRGTETYYYTPQSKAFAQMAHKRLVAATGFPDRGVKTSRFYVVHHTTMPSALVEIGFMSNPVENAQMQDPVFQQRVAKALAEAIRDYLSSL